MDDGLIEVDRFCDFVGAVRDKDGGIASEQFGSSRFAGSGSSKDEKVVISNRLHK